MRFKLTIMSQKKEEKDPLDWLVEGCGVVCEISLIALVLMVGLEVLSRNFIGVSFSGVEILSGYVLVLLTFLGGSVALKTGAVYRMSVVDNKLHPVFASILALVVHVVAITFLSTIVYYSSKLVLSSYARGVTSQANASIKLWLLQVVIPIGCSVMIVILAAGLISRCYILKPYLIKKHIFSEDP